MIKARIELSNFTPHISTHLRRLSLWWMAILFIGIFSEGAAGQEPSQFELSAQQGKGASTQRSIAQKDKKLHRDNPVPYDDLIAASKGDASLRDIAANDEDRLIAVGDRGLILYTSNAGRDWQIVDSKTTANLYSVDCNGDQCIAVGGIVGNYTGMSRGVVLHSSDSGATWAAVSPPQLPRLIGVKILGERLVAWGDYSPDYKSSVFISVDGGMSWTGQRLPIGHASAAAVDSSGIVCAIDRVGRAATPKQTLPIPIAAPNCPLNTVCYHAGSWIAAGAGGQILSTKDSTTWFDMAVPLSSAAKQLCDWNHICQHDSQLWICGSPGSLIIHSRDGGKSWEKLSTGQSLPLNSLHFTDESRGWAVGDCGLILATRDGGKSWYPQRKLGSRAGLLVVAASESALPWGPLASTLWDEQLVTSAFICQPPEPITNVGFLPNPLTNAEFFATQLGLSSLSVAHVSAASESQDSHSQPASLANREIQPMREAQLLKNILVWRPDVLLSNQSDTSNRSSQSLQPIDLSRVIQLATNASETSWPAELGLTSWQTTKWVEVSDGSSGGFKESLQRILRRPGISMTDLLQTLPNTNGLSESQTHMVTRWSKNQAKTTYASLLGGITPTTDHRRGIELSGLGNYQLLMARSHRTKAVEQLTQPPAMEVPLSQWQANLKFVCDTIPERELSPILHQLCEQLTQIRPDYHLYCLAEICRLFPNQDIADWARTELITSNYSEELLAWRKQLDLQRSDTLPDVESNAEMTVTTASFNASPFDEYEETGQPANPQPTVVTASVVEKSKPLPAAYDSKAIISLVRSGGRLTNRPDLHTLWQRVVQRSDGAPASTDNLVGEALTAWHHREIQELQLRQGLLSAIRWKAAASNATTRPFLDGHFDEPFWKDADIVELKSVGPALSQQETHVRFAVDKKYLYGAIYCSKATGQPTLPLPNERRYDASIEPLDHVELQFDTDRDGNIAITLGIAENGLTFDRLANRIEYNPQWHVATTTDHTAWTAEIAIPLDQLTTQTALQNSAWGFSARRFNPYGEEQSWSQLRSHLPLPEGNGLLLLNN